METKIIDIFISQGVWATLSLALLFYILKNQERRDYKQDEREKNYQAIISSLTKSLATVDLIAIDVKDIKKQLKITE